MGIMGAINSDSDRHHVVFESVWNPRHRAGCYKSLVSRARRLAVGAVGIVIIQEGRSQKVVRVHELAPLEEPDSLHLLHHDLRGAEVLPRELRDAKAGGEPAV